MASQQRNKTLKRPHDDGTLPVNASDILRDFLDAEAENAYNRPWHRLERGFRLNRLRKFAERQGVTGLVPRNEGLAERQGVTGLVPRNEGLAERQGVTGLVPRNEGLAERQGVTGLVPRNEGLAELSPPEVQQLLLVLTKALDRRLLNTKSTVIYEQELGEIKEIKGLIMHRQADGKMTFQMLEKKATTMRKRASPTSVKNVVPPSSQEVATMTTS